MALDMKQQPYIYNRLWFGHYNDVSLSVWLFSGGIKE